jgi:hypothetical protein
VPRTLDGPVAGSHEQHPRADAREHHRCNAGSRAKACASGNALIAGRVEEDGPGPNSTGCTWQRLDTSNDDVMRAQQFRQVFAVHG